MKLRGTIMKTIELREAEDELRPYGVFPQHYNRLRAEQSRRHRSIERRSARNRRHQEG